MTRYIPLGIKSKYCRFGIINFSDLYEHLAGQNIEAFAIADNATMRGVADMFIAKDELLSKLTDKNLKDKIKKIKPIIGSTFYMCDGEVINDKTRTSHSQITLYVKNEIGYCNLVKLSSIASTEAFYYVPRINHKLLEEHKEGLICVCGNIVSELGKAILDEDNIEKAKSIAKYYHNLFKKDYYVELQDYGLEENKKLNLALAKITEELLLKTVIINDVYYLNKEDADAHDSALCEYINEKKNAKNRFRFASEEFYLKTPDELKNTFSYLDETIFYASIYNTFEITRKCDFGLFLSEQASENIPVKYNDSGKIIAQYTPDEIRKIKERNIKMLEKFEIEFKGKLLDEIKKEIKENIDKYKSSTKALYLRVTGDKQMTLLEANEVIKFVQDFLDDETEVVFGIFVDNDFKEGQRLIECSISTCAII